MLIMLFAVAAIGMIAAIAATSPPCNYKGNTSLEDEGIQSQEHALRLRQAARDKAEGLRLELDR